jgi:hypothetical protein
VETDVTYDANGNILRSDTQENDHKKSERRKIIFRDGKPISSEASNTYYDENGSREHIHSSTEYDETGQEKRSKSRSHVIKPDGASSVTQTDTVVNADGTSISKRTESVMGKDGWEQSRTDSETVEDQNGYIVSGTRTIHKEDGKIVREVYQDGKWVAENAPRKPEKPPEPPLETAPEPEKAVTTAMRRPHIVTPTKVDASPLLAGGPITPDKRAHLALNASELKPQPAGRPEPHQHIREAA